MTDTPLINPKIQSRVDQWLARVRSEVKKKERVEARLEAKRIGRPPKPKPEVDSTTVVKKKRGRPPLPKSLRKPKYSSRSTKRIGYNMAEGESIAAIEGNIIFSKLFNQTIRKNGLQVYDLKLLLLFYTKTKTTGILFKPYMFRDRSIFRTNRLFPIIIAKLVEMKFLEKRIKKWYMWRQDGIELCSAFWKEYNRQMSAKMKFWEAMEHWQMDPENCPEPRLNQKQYGRKVAKPKWVPPVRDEESIGYKLSHEL